LTITQGKSVWLTVEGLLLIVLGVLSLVSPLFAGLAIAVVFGWLLVMVGVVGLVAAFAGRDHAHMGWSLASAAIALIVGLILVFDPLIAAEILSILIGAYLLLDGISLIGFGLDQRKRGARAWGWMIGAGVLDLALAAILFSLGGIGPTILVGVVVGVDLIIAGAALLILHRADRRSRAGWIDPTDVASRPR
jgi:uncharacterized membrane protein HdeD (DUF308 family)